MTASSNRKQWLFEFLRESLAHARLETQSPTSLICPLCWNEADFEDLTIEHVVPRSVGGTDRTTTLTCGVCNNDHGSELDSQLSQWQLLRDAFNGHGPIPVEMTVNQQRMTANLKWGKDRKDFVVVGKATNPFSVTSVQQDFQSGAVSELKFTIATEFSERHFYTALLRAAYLCIFRHYGYEYAQHETVQILRRRICDSTITEPNLKTLICELKPRQYAFDESHVIAPCTVDGVECFLVMLRLRLKGRQSRSYFGVYLPVPGGGGDEFFAMMERHAKSPRGTTISIPSSKVFH